MMETVASILSIILILLAATGLIAMISILVTLSIIRKGGFLTLGYEEDEDEIIKNNNDEKEN